MTNIESGFRGGGESSQTEYTRVSFVSVFTGMKKKKQTYYSSQFVFVPYIIFKVVTSWLCICTQNKTSVHFKD